MYPYYVIMYVDGILVDTNDKCMETKNNHNQNKWFSTKIILIIIQQQFNFAEEEKIQQT